MKKLQVAVLIITLVLNASVTAKSSMTIKEVFRENISMTVNVDKNGHIPYRCSGNSGMPWQSGSGTKKILVLLLEFPDEIHRIERKTVENYFYSDSVASVRSYYSEVSNGTLKVDLGKNGVPEWMMYKKPYEQYIKENDYDYDSVCHAVSRDAMKMAEEKGIDLAEYDSDKNKIPDIVLYFFAGDSARVGGIMPGAFTITTRLGTEVMISEDVSSRSNNTPSIIHEFAHAMIPVWDLYDYMKISDPIQDWDIMDGSSEGRCGMSAYTRWKAGWIDLILHDKYQ